MSKSEPRTTPEPDPSPRQAATGRDADGWPRLDPESGRVLSGAVRASGAVHASGAGPAAAPTSAERPSSGNAGRRGGAGTSKKPAGRRARRAKDTPSRSGRSRADGGSVVVAALATAGWAALVSFLPLLVLVTSGWLFDGHAGGSVLDALRFSVAVWLLAHGVPVLTSSGPFGLAPLGLTALVVWRLVRAGAHTARAVGGHRRTALSGALVLALGYGVLAAAGAIAVSGAGMRVSPPRALCTAGLLALVSALAGAVRETGMAAHVAGQLSAAARYGLRAGVVAALALFAAGALATGAALAWHADDAAVTLRDYGAGPVGDIGITLLCLAYAPNLVVWAVSYLTGPGFAVGAGTGVGVAAVHLGPVPALPVLAALPTEGLPWAATLLLGTPVLVGAVIGVLLARRPLGPGQAPTLVAPVVSGVTAGLLLGVAGWWSGGSLGGGRLAEVGPSSWQLGLAVALLIAVAATGATLVARRLVHVTPDRPPR